MLGLTAEYADQWNTAYLDEPESLQEPLAKIRAACDNVGRDPGTLEITAAVALAFPDLAPPPAYMESYLTGTKEEIATAIKGYEEMGVSHLMFDCSPYNEEALTRLAAGVAAYRIME
jgi:alkanesulfonate monooxygenase SsuD/methylene tetrahydromethanopterin reductase-like flavin-dependent oxidoreductase (luciferase family)